MGSTDDACNALQVDPCKYCGRKFIPSSLEKHEKICEKTFVNKRKIFDSSRQRVEQIPAVPGTNPSTSKKEPKHETSNKESSSSKKTRWREMHEEFINTIRSARGIVAAEKSGKPLPPHRPSKIPSDYIPCPHCGRHFSIKAADRHIEWCKEQKARIAQSAKCSSDAKVRLEARTKYKAPILKKKGGGPAGSSKSLANFSATQNQSSPSTSSQSNAVSVSKKYQTEEYGSLNDNSRKEGNKETKKVPKHNKGQPVRNTYQERPENIHLSGRTQHGVKNGNSAYNPYTAAELQLQDLKKNKPNIGRGTRESSASSMDSNYERLNNPHHVPFSHSDNNLSHHSRDSNSLHSEKTWFSHENSASMLRTSKSLNPPQLQNSSVQVRDKVVCPSFPNSRASWHAYMPTNSDDDPDEGFTMGSGDMHSPPSHHFSSPKSKKQPNGTSGKRLFKKNSFVYDNKPNMIPQDSDVGSPHHHHHHQNALNPPMKLPKKTAAWNPKQYGPSDVRAFDSDITLYPNNNEPSSLPPLKKRSKSYSNFSSSSSNNNSDAETWSASFCHECGTAYPVSCAKFCCECGTRRLSIS